MFVGELGSVQDVVEGMCKVSAAFLWCWGRVLGEGVGGVMWAGCGAGLGMVWKRLGKVEVG